MRRSVPIVLAAAAGGWALSLASISILRADDDHRSKRSDDPLFVQSEQLLREGRSHRRDRAQPAAVS
jgi:hypothetical protein